MDSGLGNVGSSIVAAGRLVTHDQAGRTLAITAPVRATFSVAPERGLVKEALNLFSEIETLITDRGGFVKTDGSVAYVADAGFGVTRAPLSKRSKLTKASDRAIKPLDSVNAGGCAGRVLRINKDGGILVEHSAGDAAMYPASQVELVEPESSASNPLHVTETFGGPARVTTTPTPIVMRSVSAAVSKSDDGMEDTGL